MKRYSACLNASRVLSRKALSQYRFDAQGNAMKVPQSVAFPDLEQCVQWYTKSAEAGILVRAHQQAGFFF